MTSATAPRAGRPTAPHRATPDRTPPPTRRTWALRRASPRRAYPPAGGARQGPLHFVERLDDTSTCVANCEHGTAPRTRDTVRAHTAGP
eukprot:scaffold101767_cov60-Phaeocystis_antarctica.AAC.7